MMTMHSAKGLEFDNVFIAGAEEGIFPGVQAMYDPAQVEEAVSYTHLDVYKRQQVVPPGVGGHAGEGIHHLLDFGGGGHAAAGRIARRAARPDGLPCDAR